MKKIFFFFLSFIFIFATPAYAHHLEEDGSMQAVLHISPNDEPIAQKSSVISIKIKDSAQKFNQEKCNCQVVISQKNKSLFTYTFPHTASKNEVEVIFNYTFPTEGEYQIQVKGTPTDSISFSPFQIDLETQVDQGKNVQKFLQFAYFCCCCIPIMIVVGIAVFLLLYKRKDKGA
jgi:hypothetical protein